MLIVLALHLPLFVYPVVRLSSWLEGSLLTTLAFLIPAASSQIVARFVLRHSKHWLAKITRQVADFWLGVSPILLLSLIVAEIVVATGLAQPRNAALACLTFSAFIAVVGLVTAMLPFVKTIRFESKNLNQPVQFVQITDVHIGSRSSRFLERIVDRIIAIAPDFVCITGDFIDASGVSETQLGALKRLGCPVYYCTGNHERYEDLERILTRLRNLGVQVLANQATSFREDIEIIGIDDRDDALQVSRELAKIEFRKNVFDLLLYHRPVGLEAAALHEIDLMLSGHTHNGQIFPFNLIVGRVFENLVGMYRAGNTRLYVSQGTGTWGPVMRVGTRGEITCFELTPAAPTDKTTI